MATKHERQESPEYFIFQKHYAILCGAIQDPPLLAVHLYIRGVITKAVMDHTFTLSLSTSQKINALLSAVEKQIRLDPETFHEFLSDLKKDPSMQLLVKRMESKYSCDAAIRLTLTAGRLQSLDWTSGLDWWTGPVD